MTADLTPAQTARLEAIEAAPWAERAEERGEGICRTCLAPIWNEGGAVGRRKRAEGWSDRIERGGDSLVCFKARGYRHVPLTGREAAIYDRAYARGRAVAAIDVMRGAGRHAGDLLCTYCGGPLLLEMTTVTGDDTETVEPDNLQCCDVRCGATWETDGTLRMAGTGHPDVMRGATDDGAIGR